jgi:tetratricopeptide (TPR) repeat protein
MVHFLPRHSRFCLAGVLMFLTLSSLTWAAEPGTLDSAQIQSLVLKCKNSAEQKLVDTLGQAKFLSLKQKIFTAYPTQQSTSASKSNSCPAIDYQGEQKGGVKKAYPINPGGVYYLAGMEAVFRGALEIAQWSFASASLETHSCPVYLSNLAFVLNLKGDYQSALNLLKYAQKLAPTGSSIWTNLAYSYLKLEMYDKAIMCYLVAVSLEPQIAEYQEMLVAAQAAKIEKTPSQPPALKGVSSPKPSGVHNLNAALGLLEEKKQSDFDKDLSAVSKHPALPQRPQARRSIDPFEVDRRYSPSGGNRQLSGFGPQSGAGGLFSSVAVLQKAANDAEAGANEAKTNKELRPWQRKVGSAAGLSMAALFRCYAEEGAGILASEYGDRRMLDEIRNKAKKDRELLKDLAKLPKRDTAKKAPGSASRSFSLGAITVTEDPDGTYKIGVGTGISGEFFYNPKTYNFGVKASLGLKQKIGLGPVGGEASGLVYFRVDLEKGPVVGYEASASAGAGMKLKMAGDEYGPGGLKLGEYKVVKEISLENLTLEQKKPAKKYRAPGGAGPPRELLSPEERYKIGRAPDKWPEPTEEEKAFKQLGVSELLLRQRVGQALQSGGSGCGATMGKLFRELTGF